MGVVMGLPFTAVLARLVSVKVARACCFPERISGYLGLKGSFNKLLRSTPTDTSRWRNKVTDTATTSAGKR